MNDKNIKLINITSFHIVLAVATSMGGISLISNAQVNRPWSAPRTAEDYFFRGDAIALRLDAQEKFDAFTQTIKLNPNYAEAYYEDDRQKPQFPCQSQRREQRVATAKNPSL